MKTCLLLLLLAAVSFAQEVRLFVSPHGNDGWSGRFAEPNGDDGPFATFQRAQEEIRRLRHSAQPAVPVTVYFRGGWYFLKEPIRFSPEDSGSENAPITFRNYNGEQVTFSGGRVIDNFRREGSYWTAELPDVREQGYRFQQLFVNGERRFRARTPNRGWLRVRDPMENKNWPFHYYRYTFGFYSGDLHANWRNLNDVEIVLLHFWSDAHCPIRSIDSKNLVVTLSTPAWRPFTDDYSSRGARYFIDNVFEGLDEPGEWYLDRKEGKLYYLPLPGEEAASAKVIAPDLDQLIIFQGEPLLGSYVQHIRLQGLTFAHNDWFLPPGDPGDHFAADTVPGAVKIVGGRDLTIQDCRFEHLGTYAVEVRDGSRRLVFRCNRIDDTAAGGFLITGGRAGSDSLLRTSHIQILDNRLSRLGRLYYAGIGILSMHASNNLIAHNEISDLFYTGISVGLEWGYKPSAAFGNVIEYNHIEKAGQGILSDMGGIYTLGISPGTIIRNNIIHDIETYGYGGWGIYTDEGSSDILIEKNIVYHTKSGGFHQHYGCDNIIRNNIFAFGRLAQLMRSRNEMHRSFTFERNIIYWHGGKLLDKHWRGDTTQFIFRNNIYFRTDGKPVRFLKLSAKQWQKRGQDCGSIFADPKFVDPYRGDFNLRQDSPAFSLGFEPIDLTAVGPRQWPDQVKEVFFSKDEGTFSHAGRFYSSSSESRKPLLVLLIDGTAEQRELAAAPFVKWCLLKDWVLVCPESVISTITESSPIDFINTAVDYALKNALIDTTRIYLLGYKERAGWALQTATATPERWAAVSLWNPADVRRKDISASIPPELSDNDSQKFSLLGRGSAWADNNEQTDPLDPFDKIKGPAIDIIQAIRDVADSISVKYTIDLFFKITENSESAHSAEKPTIADLLNAEMRGKENDPYFVGSSVFLRRQTDKVRLTFFAGKDDLLPNAALHWLEKQRKGH